MPKEPRGKHSDWKIRTPAKLHAALKAAADRRGVSLNQECVERLEQSLRLEGVAKNVVDSMTLAGSGAGWVVDLFEGRDRPHWGARFNWIAHPYAFDVAVKAAIKSLEAHRPPGPIIPPTITYDATSPAAAIFAGLNEQLRAGEEVGARGVAAAADEIKALQKKGTTDE